MPQQNLSDSYSSRIGLRETQVCRSVWTTAALQLQALSTVFLLDSQLCFFSVALSLSRNMVGGMGTGKEPWSNSIGRKEPLFPLRVPFAVPSVMFMAQPASQACAYHFVKAHGHCPPSTAPPNDGERFREELGFCYQRRGF